MTETTEVGAVPAIPHHMPRFLDAVHSSMSKQVRPWVLKPVAELATSAGVVVDEVMAALGQDARFEVEQIPSSGVTKPFYHLAYRAYDSQIVLDLIDEDGPLSIDDLTDRLGFEPEEAEWQSSGDPLLIISEQTGLIGIAPSGDDMTPAGTAQQDMTSNETNNEDIDRDEPPEDETEELAGDEDVFADGLQAEMPATYTAGETPTVQMSTDDFDNYVNALRTKDADIRKIAQNLTEEEAELNQMRLEVREKNKRVIALRERLMDCGRAEPGQLSIFNATNSETEEGDPGQLTPFEAGGQAYTADGDAEQVCPYGDDMPDRRQRWLDGWESAAKTASNSGPVDRVRTAEQLDLPWQDVISGHGLNCGTAQSGKPVPVTPYDQWMTKFIAFGNSDQYVSDEPPQMLVALVPIYHAKDWDVHYAELVGSRYPLGERGKVEGAPNQIDHGEHCGLELKIGRTKWVMGSVQDAVLIVEQDDGDEEEDGED